MKCKESKGISCMYLRQKRSLPHQLNSDYHRCKLRQSFLNELRKSLVRSLNWLLYSSTINKTISHFIDEIVPTVEKRLFTLPRFKMVNCITGCFHHPIVLTIFGLWSSLADYESTRFITHSDM